ncbi:MAG: triose-phosphate isomerase [Bacteroidia bacterium]|nr:triose-phosphate isomerase [Bacteroidia bacterium]NND26433.1 triose-phosphate isomerase [Flavobacteriaceae bacterium]MBT8279747.1 triose-phosphate isomerase [Bacteroidia bacterium]NNK59241.1 triose-phosphate isomerase [Flavobacteriaceae bacterium]NNL32919.1 triose-phosphate isomerase [Flavobacteriaceae bacterium]
MRQKIVAGNWKMNNDLSQTEALLTKLKKATKTSDSEVVVAPSFTNLWHAFEALRLSDIEVAAQNMHYAEKGAFTGEVSAKMLRSIGVGTVILGHSERRAYFNETDALLAKKVDAALNENMRVIFCFGEELKDRQAGNQENIVASQIKNALFHLKSSQWKHIILAYEPVWAIGTGETASPEQAQDMHAFIRSLLRDNYSDALADNTSILYGGSVKPDNAKEIFSKPDVDGGLIGGASLNAKDFFAIVNAF